MDPDEIEFSVDVGGGPDGSVIAPRGELDMATQGELRAAIERQAARGAVTLDLSGLRFLDTSGLRLVLETAEAARTRGLRVHRAAGHPGGAAPVRGRRRQGAGAVRDGRGGRHALTGEEEASRRLELLTSAGEIADGRVPLDELMPRLLDLVVPALGDCCVVYGSGREPHVVGLRVAGADAALEAAIRERPPPELPGEARLLGEGELAAVRRALRRAAPAARARAADRRDHGGVRHAGGVRAHGPALPPGFRGAAGGRARQRAAADRGAPARGARGSARRRGHGARPRWPDRDGQRRGGESHGGGLGRGADRDADGGDVRALRDL